MKAALAWCYVAGLFVAANVVAAGVMLVTGSALEMLIQAPAAKPWLMYAAGAAGAAAAVIFLRGAMEGAKRSRRTPWRKPT